MKKKYAFIVALFLCASSFATEITLKVTPTAMFPFLSGKEQKYDPVGGGAFIDVGINLKGFLNVGPEFGFIVLPKNNSKNLEAGVDPNLLIVPFGAQVSGFFSPLARLEVDGGLALGAYGAFTNERAHYAPWYRVFADASYKINTKVSVGLNLSWFNCQYNTYFGNPGAAGLTAGVSVSFKFDTQKTSGNVDVTAEYDDSVFPVLFSIYKNESIGTITVLNNEAAEIRNVKVRFRAEGYTASEQECGQVKVIYKHSSEEIPLYADFTDKVMRFSEAGKISGEVVVEYDLLGDTRVAVIPVTIPVHNRNTMRWVDPAVIASFVSSKAQEVFETSKFFVGVANSHTHSGLNKNMQYSMYILEGIRSIGVICEETSDTPYNTAHLDLSSLDYIQYPYQTLSYRSGDKDDIAILFMSMLESVGIGSAFIPLEDDFIVAINLGEANSNLLGMFNGTERILIVDDEVWLPISMKSISEGYMNSWLKGAEKVNKAIDDEEDLSFVVLADAWKAYPPSGFSSDEVTTKMPLESTLTSTVEKVLTQYINQEFGPQIADVQERIKKQGASASLYNQLGLLYVRSGQYSKAISVYEVSAKMGNVAAMNNLGNIYSLQKQYLAAKKWYENALVVDPNNETAKKNLEKIATELEN
ncbi:MAG: tetratricopeptide repeat protein [Treponema sp.]|nr:tetratricopeptide repeat protein [Treponema sp.]